MNKQPGRTTNYADKERATVQGEGTTDRKKEQVTKDKKQATCHMQRVSDWREGPSNLHREGGTDKEECGTKEQATMQ